MTFVVKLKEGDVLASLCTSAQLVPGYVFEVAAILFLTFLFPLLLNKNVMRLKQLRLVLRRWVSLWLVPDDRLPLVMS